MRALWATVIAIAALTARPLPAQATYSVAIVDTASGEYGVAAVSCYAELGALLGKPITDIYGANDHGVVVAQANAVLYPILMDTALAGLAAGQSPAQVLTQLAANPATASKLVSTQI